MDSNQCCPLIFLVFLRKTAKNHNKAASNSLIDTVLKFHRIVKDTLSGKNIPDLPGWFQGFREPPEGTAGPVEDGEEGVEGTFRCFLAAQPLFLL
jgi:hypothetical protein